MPLFSFSDTFSMYDVTPVENLFLQEFMPRAPGDYVRVYLYGLMLCYHPTQDMSPERVAKALDMEPEKVLAAYRYWERQGALERVSDSPPAYRYLNLKCAMLSGGGFDTDVYRYRDFNAHLQSLFGGRLLHPQDFDKACEWIEDLGLPEDVVLLMVKTQLERKKSVSIKSLDKMAAQWASANVRTLEEAKAFAERETSEYRVAQQVMRQFAIRREPTLEEMKLVKKWLGEWNLTGEEIVGACAETVKGRNPSFGYLDAILEANRGERGLTETMRAEKADREALKAVYRALGEFSMPTPKNITTYQHMILAGFEPEAVLLAAESVARSGRHTFADLEKSLNTCMEIGVFTKSALESYLASIEAGRARAAKWLLACGEERRPGGADVAFAEAWRAYPEELVAFAAQTARGTKTPMRYIDKLLKTWSGKGVTSVEQAKAEAASFAASGASAAKPAPALEYEQRDYKADELKGLFVDLSAEGSDEA